MTGPFPGRPRVRRIAETTLPGLTLLLLAFGAWQLLQVPRRGVADNGDFWRVTRPAGLRSLAPESPPGRFVQPLYASEPSDLGRQFSTPALLAAIAKHLSWGMSEAGEMDLRQMGALYLLLTVGVFLLGRRWGLPWLLLCGVAWVLADPGYLLFFNSFYADGALFLALLGTVFWLSAPAAGRPPAPGPRRWLYPAFPLAVALLASFSKMQYSAFALVLWLALALAEVGPGAAARRRWLLLAALGPVAILAPLHFAVGSGPRFTDVNRYHAVYGGLARLCPDPQRALAELGIPRGMAGLPRRDVFSAGISADHPVFRALEDVSLLDLAAGYLRQPVAVLNAGGEIQRALARVRSHPRGNFERSREHPRRQAFAVAWQFSGLRGRLLGTAPALVWGLLAATGIYLGVRFLRRRRGPPPVALLFLFLWVSSQMVVVVLGDGLVSLNQHLVGARLGLDLLVVWGLWEAGKGLGTDPYNHRRQAGREERDDRA